MSQKQNYQEVSSEAKSNEETKTKEEEKIDCVFDKYSEGNKKMIELFITILQMILKQL